MSTPNPEPIIKVTELVRTFGDVRAVGGMSFEVPPGRVVGFVGANGAGKTTTMRIMATLDLPTSGAVQICGFDALDHPMELRHRIGWMPDSYGVYPNVTVWEYLDFMARSFGYSGTDRRRRTTEVTEFTELGPLAHREMSALSKGEAQRLCLARALINDPGVMILDEPAAGLDPRARADFKRLIRILADDGKTVFISSHILSELAEMCDSMLFVDKGTVIYDGPADGLTRPHASGAQVKVEVIDQQTELLSWVNLAPEVELVEALQGGARLRLESQEPQALANLLRRLVKEGFLVSNFVREEVRLEDAFISLLDKIKADA